MWTFILPNTIIAISYFMIPLALGMLMLLNPGLPHRWISLLFIAFIVACGVTHAMHVIDYAQFAPHASSPASVVSDWACAVLSIGTAIAIGAYVHRLQGFLIMVGKRDA